MKALFKYTDMQLIKFETPELNQLQESKALAIKNVFEPMAKKIEEFEEAYNLILKEAGNEMTEELISSAKRLRLDISKVRINTEKLRKSQKAEYLLAGKAIDGISNILKWAVSEKEEKLKEIELFFIKQEEEKIFNLQRERESLLEKYIDDPSRLDLGNMDNDVWESYLKSKKEEYSDRIEAERIQKELREKREREEAERLKRIESENARLKVEAEERERLAKIEEDKRKKAEQERIAKEEAEKAKLKAIQEAKEAKLRAEIKAKEDEAKRLAKIEEDKRKKLEAELKAKEEAEKAAKEAEEKRLEAELNKGDKDKFNDLLSDLEHIKTKYSFKSKKNKNMYSDVCILIDKVIIYINK